MSDDRFARFAIEHLSDATYFMEEDARIIYVNEAASRLTGYSIDELRAMKVYELNADIDPTVWVAVWGLLKAERQRTFEARHRCKDGRLLDVEISAHFLELDGKEYSCAFVRDNGARKLLEQRLRHAEKMEAIGRLAGGVAHDFNNQLGAIMGYADLLRRRTRDNPEAGPLVDELARIVRVAAGVTSQLLAFSRRGKFLIEPVDVHTLVDDVVTMLTRSVDKRIAIMTGLAAERCWVAGDRSQLQSAVLNLALNARDAMPDGGTLSLISENVEIGPGLESDRPPELTSGSYLALAVRDTGVGMDRETQERVFEPFFTTKEASSGTGLGLAAVYGTARNHKGAVTVDSTPGRGSRFTLYLPVIRPPAKDAAQSARHEPVGMRLHGHVLVVDDEAALRSVGAQMLEALGCSVTAVADGKAALRVFAERPGAVDLVLLDLVLPGMTGAETLAAIRQIDTEVPVLLMSGYSLDGEAQGLIDRGAKGLLQKPFDMAELAGKVGAALALRR